MSCEPHGPRPYEEEHPSACPSSEDNKPAEQTSEQIHLQSSQDLQSPDMEGTLSLDVHFIDVHADSKLSDGYSTSAEPIAKVPHKQILKSNLDKNNLNEYGTMKSERQGFPKTKLKIAMRFKRKEMQKLPSNESSNKDDDLTSTNRIEDEYKNRAEEAVELACNFLAGKGIQYVKDWMLLEIFDMEKDFDNWRKTATDDICSTKDRQISTLDSISDRQISTPAVEYRYFWRNSGIVTAIRDDDEEDITSLARFETARTSQPSTHISLQPSTSSPSNHPYQTSQTPGPPILEFETSSHIYSKHPTNWSAYIQSLKQLPTSLPISIREFIADINDSDLRNEFATTEENGARRIGTGFRIIGKGIRAVGKEFKEMGMGIPTWEGCKESYVLVRLCILELRGLWAARWG